MNITIRNIDETVYRELKARAALAGKTIGELLNEAIRAYLVRPEMSPRRATLRDLTPEDYPDGCERLSEEIDAIVKDVRAEKSLYERYWTHRQRSVPSSEAGLQLLEAATPPPNP